MENIIFIKNNGETIKCFKQADNTIINYTFINRRINKLRPYLQDVISSNFKFLDSNFVYELYFYDSNDNNAFATRIKTGYVIAFSTSLFSTLYNRFIKIFNNKKTRNLLEIEDDSRTELLINTCFDYSTFFIALHELSHILNGHCKLNTFHKLFNRTKFINEINSYLDNPVKNYFQQQKECYADLFATALLSGTVYAVAFTEWQQTMNASPELKSEDVKLEFEIFEFRFAIFAIYNLCLLFDEKIAKTLDLKKYSHPLACLRIKYIIPFLINCEQMHYSWSQSDILFVAKHTYNLCKTFSGLDTNDDFIKSINTIANTEYGDNYCLDLLNSFQKIFFLHTKTTLLKRLITPKVDKDFIELFKKIVKDED